MTDDLINTLETPGEFDALANLRPGEPYFLLLGRDRLAPDLVASWADANRRRALAESDDGKINSEKLDRELRKSTQAEIIGCAMKAYKAGQPVDPPNERQAAESYSGYKGTEDSIRRDKEQAARARAIRAMHNAIAEMSDAIPALPEEDGDLMQGTVETLERVIALVTPKRPGPSA